LGCGTGRVSIPIAKAGIDVVGLDTSKPMLDLARSKAKKAGLSKPKISFLIGDMREFSLGRTFPIIIVPFRSFLALLNVPDQRSCLESIKSHLAPDGILILDIFVPDLDTLTEVSATPAHAWDVTQSETGSRLIVWDQSTFDNHNQVIDARMIIDEVSQSGQVLGRVYQDFQIRYIHRFEIHHLLEVCGLRILAEYGEFDYSPLEPSSSEMVIMATHA
jgi:SAM-dependent methyltransferase